MSAAESGILEIAIHEAHGWEGFNKVRNSLKSRFAADEADLVEGPDAAKVVLHIDDFTIEAQFEDPWGTSLFAHSNSARNALPIIAKEVRQDFVNDT